MLIMSYMDRTQFHIIHFDFGRHSHFHYPGDTFHVLNIGRVVLVSNETNTDVCMYTL